MKVINSVKIILRGAARVMLQDNPITGLLFLIGIFYNSWLLGIGAVIGILVATITAVILKYKKEDIISGNYGFNGALVGVALLFFFKVNILLIILLIVGSILSSIIMNFMSKRKLAPYTFPFVLSTWILMILIKLFNLIPKITIELIEALKLNIVSSLSMGFGQVMFQENVVTGIIFLIAIFVGSKRAAIYAFIGSLIGMLLALALIFPLNLINIGIFGFNGVLCGIAFADKKKYSLIYAIIAIILSVFIVYGMISFNLIALTAPFVFATWITLGLKRVIIRKKLK
jgi:urea transporter